MLKFVEAKVCRRYCWRTFWLIDASNIKYASVIYKMNFISILSKIKRKLYWSTSNLAYAPMNYGNLGPVIQIINGLMASLWINNALRLYRGMIVCFTNAIPFFVQLIWIWSLVLLSKTKRIRWIFISLVEQPPYQATFFKVIFNFNYYTSTTPTFEIILKLMSYVWIIKCIHDQEDFNINLLYCLSCLMKFDLTSFSIKIRLKVYDCVRWIWLLIFVSN